jgi:probable HAF family extracellular repeat protein
MQGGDGMKLARLNRVATALLINLAIFSTYLTAQEDALRHHQRYRLVDVGTFGGPNSVYNVFTRIATDDGRVVGAANTAAPDPNAPHCFDLDTCLVQHAWQWRKGELTDLGVLADGFSSYTNAINTRGLVVGQSQKGELDPLTGTPVLYIATVWEHGRIRSLGTFGGGNSIAIAATDQNFVVGAAENGIVDTSGFTGFDNVSQIRAFGWSGGEIFDLGTLGGTGAFPSDMNNRGQVVGNSPTTSIPGPFGVAPVAPFLWEKGRMRNLGTLGGTFGGANAINSGGEVVGSSSLAENPFACLTGEAGCHPFIWQHGKLEDLGTLGGTFANGEWLNDVGEVIGFSRTTGDESIHAFFWKHYQMTDLETIGGDNASNAFGVNVRSQVVGQSWFFDGQEVTASHAFLWENSGPMIDLNTVVFNPSDLNLVEADFITDRGWIIARGFLPNGDLHTAILIPEGDENDMASNAIPIASVGTATSSQKLNALTPQMQIILKARLAQIYRRGALVGSWHRQPSELRK